MSIRIDFYKNNSPINAINKNIESLANRNIDFKDPYMYTTPKIILQLNANAIGIMNNANYALINNRYYFITNKKILRDGIYEIDLEIDLLMTYKDQIKSCTGIVKRQQNEYNLDLNDGSLKVYQNPHIITKPFPSGFSGSSYVLAVAGA